MKSRLLQLRQAEPDLTLAEIGRKLKINQSAIPKRGDTKKEIADKKNSMSATVSRYLRKTTAIGVSEILCVRPR